MNLKNQYILLIDGEKIFLSEVLRLSSFDLYQTSLHFDVSQKLAKYCATDIVEQRLLTNLFALKSSLARSATALTAYIENSHLAVAEFCISSKLLSLLNPKLTKNSIVHDWSGKEPEYIDLSHGILLLLKAIAHNFFRLLSRVSRRHGARDILVRAWVEVTPKMYQNEVCQGIVLIYPFALNFKRQLKFIIWCSKCAIRYEFSGLPYSISKIFVQLVKKIPCYQILLSAEKNANLQHCEELLKQGPKSIFTSDEFEIGAFLLYEKLVATGVSVVNTAHGVGQYCPYICYSEFRVISNYQSLFYRERNSSVKYSLLPPSNLRVAGIDRYELSLSKPLAFVLVHQPFKESGLTAEDFAMNYLDETLCDVSRELSVNYFIKMHPNYSDGVFWKRKSIFKGQAVYKWSDVNDFRLVFITVNSSVVLDVRGLGPALVYAGATFAPSLYFPEPIFSINKSNAELVLKSLISIENWVQASSLHAGEMVYGCSN
jgi:hypothetical protein